MLLKTSDYQHNFLRQDFPSTDNSETLEGTQLKKIHLLLGLNNQVRVTEKFSRNLSILSLEALLIWCFESLTEVMSTSTWGDGSGMILILNLLVYLSWERSEESLRSIKQVFTQKWNSLEWETVEINLGFLVRWTGQCSSPDWRQSSGQHKDNLSNGTVFTLGQIKF